jgi:hypothetical protein
VVNLGAGTVNVNTGGGAGNILFTGAVAAPAAQNLDLTAGTGDVTFTGAVGSVPLPLGDLTVHSSGTLTANSTINAAKIDIRGNTAVNLLGNVDATDTFTSRGGNFNLPGGITIDTHDTNLLIANTGTVTVAGTLDAGTATAAFGSLDWSSSKTSAVIGGKGTVTASTIIIGGKNVGTGLTAGSHGLTLNAASANNVFFNLGLGGVDFSGHVLAGNFAGADVPLDHINTEGRLKIGDQTFGANTVDFSSLLTISAQQERIEKLLRAAATAEFFMKAPLWIDILMEEDEEECDPDDEECLKRKRERETSWLAPGNLRPSRLGVYRPTLLYEETEAGDLVIQLSSLR